MSLHSGWKESEGILGILKVPGLAELHVAIKEFALAVTPEPQLAAKTFWMHRLFEQVCPKAQLQVPALTVWKESHTIPFEHNLSV
jgi:hypothetical protein